MQKRKERICLDTSVISAYFDGREKTRRSKTQHFWKIIRPQFDCFITDVTLQELKNTADDHLKSNFLSLIEGIKTLKTNEESKELAHLYVNKEVFPKKYFSDALIIAIASVNDVDFILSFNFSHMVKVKTKRLIKLINALERYREIDIISPLEL